MNMFGIGPFELLIFGMLLICPLVVGGVVLLVVLKQSKNSRNPPDE